MESEKIQKIIAASGLCSRRKAEQLIEEGRVTVNGRVAKLGERADPEKDAIKVDGKLLKKPGRKRYILMFKPRGVVTTCSDPEGRPTVTDLLGKKVKERVYPVGRLDYNSEGLLILTNDGELAARLMHPRYHVVKEYHVKVKGDLNAKELAKLKRGTTIYGRKVRPLSVKKLSVTKRAGNSWWEVRLGEGRTREIRELFFRAGHHVQRLRRVAIGPIRDSFLKPGQFRDLTPQEVEKLKGACGLRKSRSSQEPQKR